MIFLVKIIFLTKIYKIHKQNRYTNSEKVSVFLMWDVKLLQIINNIILDTKMINYWILIYPNYPQAF